MGQLANKTVVIVGGSSGIGLGVANASSDRGARVVLIARDQARLDAAAAGVLGATGIAADATREDDIARAFESIGAFDHLVVTAADLRYVPIASVSIEAARATIDSKLLAAVLLTKHAAPRIQAGGSLVFVTGVAADRPAPKGALVAAVNGALTAFVRACAVELAPIRVNALSPGWVDTPFWDRMAPAIANGPKQPLLEAMAKRYPVRRVGTPADLGHAAVFLMENEFTTGTALTVDGGHRLI